MLQLVAWVAVISAVSCDSQHPYLCCSSCPGADQRYEQVTDYKDKKACNAFAHDWAMGKTFTAKRLFGGFCEER